MKNTIICDIDGTIADVRHRLHYIRNEDGSKKRYKDTDWDGFNKACCADAPFMDVIQLVANAAKIGTLDSLNLYFFSGRNEVVRAATITWLQTHAALCGVNWYGDKEWDKHLIMRSEGDRRPDTQIKGEMADAAGLTPENVLAVFDDRQCVVDMWREKGFRVMQVTAWQEVTRT